MPSGTRSTIDVPLKGFKPKGGSGVLSMWEECPRCGKPLKTTRFSVPGLGLERDVYCYGSCGCEASQRDMGIESRTDRLLSEAGIPSAYMLADCDLKGMQLAVHNGRSLYIHGPNGVGKTYFACALARALVNLGDVVYFANSYRLVSEIQRTYSGRSTDVLDRCYACRVLVLDDLGKEMPTAYSAGVLYGLVDQRVSEGKPTVTTSNFSRGELLARFAQSDEATAEALVSRLCEGTETMRMDGTDKRIG